ncbi:MAG: FKBP-type peptidyl-prolyl cis-trans isomerase [Methanosarcinales archaeon]|nr:FKBP-type peptidyl-prolyl cis-trans isomerase [Methanosarcinales archaeon]
MEQNNNNTKIILIIVAVLSVCLIIFLQLGNTGDGIVVENGNIIQVNYTGKLLDGTVFDTSDPDIANESGLYNPMRPYQPLEFVVGSGKVIEGFDTGVLGMKKGEKKTLTIPPEQAYGPDDPTMIRVLSLIDDIPATQPLQKEIALPIDQFNFTFDANHTEGDIVQLPESTINMTIVSMDENVSLSIIANVGDTFKSAQSPWEEEVIKVNSTHITVEHVVEVGDIIAFPGTPWNSTVTEVTDTNITIEHNPIPDETIQTPYGAMDIQFNETGIIMDTNPPLAGETLVFDIEIVSIIKPTSTEEPTNEIKNETEP